MTAQYAFYIYPDDAQDGEIGLAITDLQYFQTKGFASDWPLSHDVKLPDYLYELSGGVFVSSKDKSKTASSLKYLGFVEDMSFNSFMLNHC